MKTQRCAHIELNITHKDNKQQLSKEETFTANLYARNAADALSQFEEKYPEHIILFMKMGEYNQDNRRLCPLVRRKMIEEIKHANALPKIDLSTYREIPFQNN